jgi:hypothetical protein
MSRERRNTRKGVYGFNKERGDMKHTPEPWKMEKRTTRGEFVTDTLITGKHGAVVAKLHCEAEGNGPLIAAAPDLLYACALLKECWEQAEENQQVDWDSLNMATEKAIEAYNKATGGIVKEDTDI